MSVDIEKGSKCYWIKKQIEPFHTHPSICKLPLPTSGLRITVNHFKFHWKNNLRFESKKVLSAIGERYVDIAFLLSIYILPSWTLLSGAPLAWKELAELHCNMFLVGIGFIHLPVNCRPQN